MNDLTGHDYITQPSFRLLTELELQDRARKDLSLICIAAGCEERRYEECGPNGVHSWVVCAKHREKYLRAMDEWNDNGFSEMVTDEFKRKLKFGPSRPQVIEELPMAEIIRRNPRKGWI